MVVKIDVRAVQTELRAISNAMSEITRLMGPQIWQGGSAASFTSDLQGHNRSLNRLMFEVMRTVARVNQTPSTYETPDIPRPTPAGGSPGVASVSPNGLERLETALTRAADRLPHSAKMIRGLLALAYPDIPGTVACDHAANWCRDQSSRTRTRIMYALAENQANPLLAGPALSPIPDLERFGRKEMTELGRLQATALTKTLNNPTAFTPELISEMARTLRTNTKDDGYLTAFFNNVPPGSVGKLAYRLHQQHGGTGLTPDDKKIIGDFGTALATLSRKKDGHTAVTRALGPAGADMPGQALLVKLSAPNVKWSSAVLVDLAKAALRWRQKYPSYTITQKVVIDRSQLKVTANQPDHPWWQDWGLASPSNGSSLREYDPTLSVLGRISLQRDQAAARNLASTELEGAFTIKDAEKADPLTWLSRGNGGTYASMLIAPDWPDGGKAAGSVIQLATTPEKGHEEEAAMNAAEIMKTVAWWNDKGRDRVDKLLKKDTPPDWLPWFDILPRTDQAPPGTDHSKHYAAELGPGMRTALLNMTRMHLPTLGTGDLAVSGTGLPSTDHVTGRTYVNVGGQEIQSFLRTLAADDRAWAQLAIDAQTYRQRLFAWALRHHAMGEAADRSGYLEGNLIAAYVNERSSTETLTQKQFEDAQKHLGLLRDLLGSGIGATPAGQVPGLTDTYGIGSNMALEKVKYKDFEKNLEKINATNATYGNQLYIDLARGYALANNGHTGKQEIDALLRQKTLTEAQQATVIQWTMEHTFRPGTPHQEALTGMGIIRQVENGVNQNRPSK
ncbi:hypothetical protein [Actinomadura macra]|uniref:hypothetical protein n=1 Tax=Actinomadura macra TaxID=46164 RepID=UPI00082E47DF|nr:hypothetical protein [Actinomadura macra]